MKISMPFDFFPAGSLARPISDRAIFLLFVLRPGDPSNSQEAFGQLYLQPGIKD
jgi:hypothetical protein